MKIGFVGLGNMGARMVVRLLAAGHEVLVRDNAALAQEAAVSAGARGIPSLKELADAVEVVLCSLPTPAIVESVAAELVHGEALKLVVDLSTTGAETTARVASSLGSRGIAFIDAPVSGGTSGAAAGTLAVMASGPAAAFETVRPLLDVLARNVFYLGDTPGLGQTMKLVNNMLCAAGMVASCEALTFGAASGLDLKTMLDIINVSSGRSFATEVKVPECILSGDFPMRFTTELLHKDVALGLKEAETAGAAMWVIPMVRQFLAFAISQGDGQRDYAHVVAHYEKWAGVELARRRMRGGDHDDIK